MIELGPIKAGIARARERGHNHKMLDDMQALVAEVERLQAMTQVTMGVGDGGGNLFIHGSYEAICRVRALMFPEQEKIVQSDR